MPSRALLNAWANALGFDPSTVSNDSKLEQKLKYLMKKTTTITGTAPTTTLTSSGTAGDAETFTLGTQIYTVKTALTGVLASGTLTSNATIPNDGDIVVIGPKQYIFRTALSTGATLAQTITPSTNIYEVLINGSAANALTKLKAAINASGTPGTDYSSNLTAAHPLVTAGALGATTLVVAANLAGTPSYVGGSISTFVSTPATTLSWGAKQLTGGVNPVANEILIGAAATNTLDNIKDALNGTTVSGNRDVTYSSNTGRHQDVTAGAKNATTVVIAMADTNANGGLATTETMANFAFTAGTMSAGVDGSLAPANTFTNNQDGGIAGAKNTTL